MANNHSQRGTKTNFHFKAVDRQATSVDKEMLRLQREIVTSDKRLIEKLMKGGKGRDVLYPIYQEVNSNQRSASAKSRDYHTREDNSLEEERIQEREVPNKSNRYSREEIEKKSVAVMNTYFERSSDIRYITKKIFLFYVSFGDRLNANYLKGNKLYKMMHDASILDENITKKKLDLLFAKFSKNKSSLDFQSFLSMLINIATLKFPSLDSKVAFLELFNIHLKPLYSSLYSETDIGEYDLIYKEPLEDEVIAALQSIAPVVSKLHKSYFENEYQILDKKDTRIKSEQALCNLLKEFEICPTILNMSVAYSLMQEVFDTSVQSLAHNPDYEYIVLKDEGREFTLNRLLAYLGRLSLLVFLKFFQETKQIEDIPQVDKLLLLLEKMEYSMGFANFTKKISTTNNSTISLIPSKIVPKRTNLSETIGNGSQINLIGGGHRLDPGYSFGGQRKMQETIHNNSSVSPARGGVESSYNTARSKSPNHQNTNSIVSELKPGIAEIAKENNELLQKIYRAYSTSIASGTKWKMTLQKLFKLLKDANLMREGDAFGSRSPKRSSPLKTHAQLKNLDNSKLIDQREVDLFYVKIVSKNTKSSTNISRTPERTSSPFRRDEEYNSNAGNFLNFDQFIKILEMISSRIFSDLDEDTAFHALIETYLYRILDEKKMLMKNIDTKSHLKKLMQILKEASVVDILGKLKKALHPFYNLYADESGIVDSDRFVKFCRDFEIFPHVLPRGKIMQLFYNLASLYPFLTKQRNPNAIIKADEVDEPIIDENLFVEALALCASEIEDRISAHIVDKVSYLLERMVEAAGMKTTERVLRNSNKTNDAKKPILEVIHYIKTKYSQIIESKKEPLNQKRKMRFEELFPDQ